MNDQSSRIADGVNELCRAFHDAAALQGWHVTHWDILDLLHLASSMPHDQVFATGQADVSPEDSADEDGQQDESPDSSSASTDSGTDTQASPTSTESVVDLLPVYKTTDIDQSDNLLQVPAPPPIRNKREIVRALRPLFVRGDSRIKTIVDIPSTVRRITDERICEIIQSPAKERSTDLVLLVDEGPSMDMWRTYCEEFIDLCQNSGGFRSVHAFHVRPKPPDPQAGEGNKRVEFIDSTTEHVVDAKHIRSLRPSAKATFLVLSDCVSSHWAQPAWLAALDEFAHRGATAILQVLPEGLWSRTYLGDRATHQLSGTQQLAPSALLRRKPLRTKDWVPQSRVPKRARSLSFEPIPVACVFSLIELGALTRVIAGGTSHVVAGFQLDASSARTPVSQLTPLDQLACFEESASGAAKFLAGLLASAPTISLPICRIIEATFLPDEGGPLLESEVWNSGLLQPVAQTHDADPEQVLYAFDEDVRKKLNRHTSREMSWTILRKTSEYIEKNLGRLGGFTAMLQSPKSRLAEFGHAQGDPFARVALSILKQHGYDAQQLTDSQSESTTSSGESAGASKVPILRSYSESDRFARFEWSPDGQALAIAAQSGRLYIWYPFDEKETLSVNLSSHGLNDVAWSPHGKQLAVACYSNVIRIVNSDGHELSKLQGHTSDVTCVAWSPDGKLLASGTAGGSVRIWKAAKGTVLSQRGYPGGVRDVEWINDDELAVASEQDVHVLACENEQRAGLQQLYVLAQQHGRSLLHLRQTRNGVQASTLYQDPWLPSHERLVAIGQKDGDLCFFDVDAQKELLTFSGLHHSAVAGLDHDASGRILAAICQSGAVKILDLETGGTADVGGPANKVLTRYASLGFRPNSRMLAYSVAPGEIAISDLSALRIAAPENREQPQEAGRSTVEGKILWVDDRPENNATIAGRLEERGLSVATVTSTLEALELLDASDFEVVVSDMGRPEGPQAGYELLDALRSRNLGIPYLFFAGSRSYEHRTLTRKRGGNGCTNDGRELVDMVLSVVEGKNEGDVREFFEARLPRVSRESLLEIRDLPPSDRRLFLENVRTAYAESTLLPAIQSLLEDLWQNTDDTLDETISVTLQVVKSIAELKPASHPEVVQLIYDLEGGTNLIPKPKAPSNTKTTSKKEWEDLESESPDYEAFDMKDLFDDSSFSWRAALSAALCCRLSYDDRTTNESNFEEIALSLWGFESATMVGHDRAALFARHDNRAVVAFTGMTGVGDWINNLDVRTVKWAVGRVHSGFLHAVQVLQNEIEQLLVNIPSPAELVITGHGYGGALATIAAATWQEAYSIRSTITFGQPAVGDKDFRDFVARSRIPFYRIVNDDDIVPKVPPSLSHVGQLLHLDHDGKLLTDPKARSATDVEPPNPFGEHSSKARSEWFRIPSVRDHSLTEYMRKVAIQANASS